MTSSKPTARAKPAAKEKHPAAPPPAPAEVAPPATWPHSDLYRRVKEAIRSLPGHFVSETYIEGISATDIFTLSAALGATIEEQVVSTLNSMRDSWDPDGKYSLYRFVRQPQTFPDVLLLKDAEDAAAADRIILGIELKGWYMIAKEGEPSFRFQATPGACAPQDLIVVVPWALKNVISGSPCVYAPYIKGAKHAALLRNHHWQHLRETGLTTEITAPAGITPYPKKTEQISDKPVSDKGGNFGRFARTGLMDDYIKNLRRERLCGIAVEHWLDFFKLFVEQRDAATIKGEIEKLRAKVGTPAKGEDGALSVLGEIISNLELLITKLEA